MKLNVRQQTKEDKLHVAEAEGEIEEKFKPPILNGR